jgi:hypothetical protein
MAHTLHASQRASRAGEPCPDWQAERSSFLLSKTQDPDPGGPQSLAGPPALFGQRGPLGPAPLRFGPPAAHGDERAGLRGRPLIGASGVKGF